MEASENLHQTTFRKYHTSWLSKYKTWKIQTQPAMFKLLVAAGVDYWESHKLRTDKGELIVKMKKATTKYAVVASAHHLLQDPHDPPENLCFSRGD